MLIEHGVEVWTRYRPRISRRVETINSIWASRRVGGPRISRRVETPRVCRRRVCRAPLLQNLKKG